MPAKCVCVEGGGGQHPLGGMGPTLLLQFPVRAGSITPGPVMFGASTAWALDFNTHVSYYPPWHKETWTSSQTPAKAQTRHRNVLRNNLGSDIAMALMASQTIGISIAPEASRSQACR